MFDLFITFLIGTFAGFTGSFVGGGAGIVTVPFLLFTGIPPHIAVASNHLGALGRATGALLRYLKSDKILWHYVPLFAVLAMAGGYFGAHIFVSIDPDLVEKLIGIIIILVAPFLLIKKDFGIEEAKEKITGLRLGIGSSLYFLLMSFGGFFGPGTGFFARALEIGYFKMSFIQSMATSKIPWMLMRLSALFVLLQEGFVDWFIGLSLMAGMFVGGWIGTDRALHFGDKIVKKAFAIACIILGLVILLK